MPAAKIEPHKITTPMAVNGRLVRRLVLLDGPFLAAASRISTPIWVPVMLAISAVAFVPLFLVAVFLMQTVFRSHLQSDKYYADWLKRQELRSQATTTEPLPPQAPSQQPALQAAALFPTATKMLRTLWHYQKQHFQNAYSKRWMFAINPLAPEYATFLSGLSEVVQRSLVAVSPENHLCMLTNEGIAYMEQHPDLQGGDDVYAF
jgi:hypothetical protein